MIVSCKIVMSANKKRDPGWSTLQWNNENLKTRITGRLSLFISGATLVQPA
jgi:hypothetical protein